MSLPQLYAIWLKRFIRQYLETPEFGVKISKLVEDLANSGNLQRNVKAMA
jgi:hypothetical protein